MTDHPTDSPQELYQVLCDPGQFDHCFLEFKKRGLLEKLDEAISALEIDPIRNARLGFIRMRQWRMEEARQLWEQFPDDLYCGISIIRLDTNYISDDQYYKYLEKLQAYDGRTVLKAIDIEALAIREFIMGICLMVVHDFQNARICNARALGVFQLLGIKSMYGVMLYQKSDIFRYEDNYYNSFLELCRIEKTNASEQLIEEAGLCLIYCVIFNGFEGDLKNWPELREVYRIIMGDETDLELVQTYNLYEHIELIENFREIVKVYHLDLLLSVGSKEQYYNEMAQKLLYPHPKPIYRIISFSHYINSIAEIFLEKFCLEKHIKWKQHNYKVQPMCTLFIELQSLQMMYLTACELKPSAGIAARIVELLRQLTPGEKRQFKKICLVWMPAMLFIIDDFIDMECEKSKVLLIRKNGVFLNGEKFIVPGVSYPLGMVERRLRGAMTGKSSLPELTETEERQLRNHRRYLKHAGTDRVVFEVVCFAVKKALMEDFSVSTLWASDSVFIDGGNPPALRNQT